jgi:long-subunit fatty acid transport protein
MGHKSSVDFAFAGTYENKLQLGVGVSAYSIEYTENNTLVEDGYDSTSDLQLLKMRNALKVDGSGVSIKLGAIYKLTSSVRLSLAYHSPEWLEINETLKQSVYTERLGGDIYDLSPSIETVFAPYRVITPSKWIAGASMVVNKKGLISVDYTYQDISRLRFKEKDYDADTSYFDGINDGISDSMQAVHKLNVGGEVKMKDLILRAGTFLATSPVKSDKDNFVNNGFSIGLGYDFGGFVVDATFLKTLSKYNQNVLNVPDVAKVNSSNNKFFVGVRYNF